MSAIDVWFVLVITALAGHSKLLPLRCQSKGCVELPKDPFSTWIKYKVEGKQLKVWHNTNTFQLKCQKLNVLDSHTLPVANPAVEVHNVWLINCPLPTNSSIAEILSVLNVTLKYNKTQGKLIFDSLPPAPALTAAHFTGLGNLNHLEILGARNLPPSLASKCLTPLRRLEILKIENVVATELEVPSMLRELKIYNSNLTRLPDARVLQALTLYGLKKLWTTPLPYQSLRKMSLVNSAVNFLPDYWLKNCSFLEDLEITGARKLFHLPATLLQDAKSLKRLFLTENSLKELPVGFLNHTPQLQVVELCKNQFSTFPRNMFVSTNQIEKLDLSSNELESSAIAALAPLVQLTELNLAKNQNLGNFCPENGYSPLQNLTKLKELDLSWTRITRICLDWKHNMTQLKTLDLGHTRLSNIRFKDLQFNRMVESSIMLPNMAARAIEMTREDYYKVARNDFRNITLVIYATLQCDCRLYWTRRALSLSPPVFQFVDRTKCLDGRLLQDVPPDSMTCLRPDECEGAGLPKQCQCEMWAPDHAPDLVRVRCEYGTLYSVPHPTWHKPDRVYEMLLAHNRIADPFAEDIQKNIQVLDLRYNPLKMVDEATAKKILNMDGLIKLGGEPMDCSCNAAPLLRALHARNETLIDLSNATCSDGSLLLDAAIIDCPISLETILKWLAGVFTVVLVIVVVGVTIFWSQQRRFFARAVLHRWGVRWRVDEPADDDREFDAFLTFSHKDSAVARAVLTRLEPQYRLCVHVRDWTPGELIPAQIAKSVRESRRTVALVSRHFLESKWAPVEFREAHTASILDARPRLVVVLLEEPGALQMDEELRGYIATRTYLRWGESLFWHKMALALPRQRLSPHPPPLMELLPLPSDNPEPNASESLLADTNH